MIALVDTSVVVDLFRQYPPALDWLETQGQLGITRAVWIEILEGVPNKAKQESAIRLLRRFALVELTTEDVIHATQMLITYKLAYNIDGYDCMIAAATQRLQLPLYTRNLKHFEPLIGALAVRPY